jgi:hypothetical protein
LIGGILFVLQGFVGQEFTQDKYHHETDYADNYESEITQSVAPLISGGVLGRPFGLRQPLSYDCVGRGFCSPTFILTISHFPRRSKTGG